MPVRATGELEKGGWEARLSQDLKFKRNWCEARGRSGRGEGLTDAHQSGARGGRGKWAGVAAMDETRRIHIRRLRQSDGEWRGQMKVCGPTRRGFGQAEAEIDIGSLNCWGNRNCGRPCAEAEAVDTRVGQRRGGLGWLLCGGVVA